MKLNNNRLKLRKYIKVKFVPDCVYIVLLLTPTSEPYITGVYTTREIADKVAAKLRHTRSSGDYVCVLKKRVKGP